MATGMFTPNTPFQGPQQYDISGIQAGVNAVQNASPYNPAASRSFTFSNPNVGSVQSRNIVGGPSVTGRMQSPGPYGVASRGDVLNAYQSGFGAAAAPIRSQGRERMRQLAQGFEGGRMTGNANRAFALQNAQKTGEDLRDVARNMGYGIQQEMFNQGNMARARDYETNLGIEQDYQKQLRDRDLGRYSEETTRETEDASNRREARQMQFTGELNRQERQANEDYRNAQFTDSQAQFQANNSMQRAMNLLGAGFAFPQLQSQLYDTQLGGWDRMQGLGAVAGGTR